MSKFGVWILISPALALFASTVMAASFNNIESFAAIMMLPASPVPVLADEIVALEFILSDFVWISILPAVPLLDEDVLISPESDIFKMGVCTVTEPAEPAPVDVLYMPLASSVLPEIVKLVPAATVMLPPEPEPAVLLSIRLPSVIDSVSTFKSMLPPDPDPPDTLAVI